MNKKVKLVNVIQAMLFRRILPCQQRAFNLWEFDPAQHQYLNRLFDTTHEDAWKVLFKGAEAPPPTTEDRGLCVKRQASAVSCFTFHGTLVVIKIDSMRDLNSWAVNRTGRRWPDKSTVQLPCPKALQTPF